MLLFGLLIAALLSGLFLVAAVLVLTVLSNRQETRRLAARVETLEGEVQRLRERSAGGPAASAQEPPQPEATTPTASAPAPASIPVPGPAPTREAGTARHNWFSAARAWLFGGNTVVRVGVVILFFGVAFFLGYVAERGWLPIELRLGGAAAAGAVLLGIGWRLRHPRREYALALQGGGAGIVYLTAFAAVNFYDLIGATVGLGVMVVLVVLATVLAVKQDARSLAVLASLGGFLGPVLVSRDGSHVALFSYYAALDAGIVAVAWFRSWRVLNLLGAGFTFIIGAMWGSTFYEPEHFATTQPFLALFFVLFASVPVLNARRPAPRLTGYVDGTLVFGVPLAAYVLQHRLASGFEYGPAFSALAFSVFYATAAGALRRRRQPAAMPLLVQSFVALAVAFATLAVPLAFDGRWTSAAWALEGAALVWVGVRQDHRLAVLSGLALQLLAGLARAGEPPTDGLPVVNIVYLGGLLLSLSGLLSAWVLHRAREGDGAHPRLSVAALVWGTAWWFGAGAAEVSRHLSSFDQHSATLGFVAVSFGAFGWIRRRLDWKDLAVPPLLLLPAMLAFALAWLALASSPLAHWGVVAWPGAFLVLYWLLRRLEADWPRAAPLWHRGGLWLATFFGAWEGYWRVGQLIPGGAWSFVVWALAPAAAVWSLTTFGSRLAWPVRRFQEAYLGSGQIPPVLFVAGWILVAATHRGDPEPLGYVPILNPVELVQILSLGFLLWWGAAGTSTIGGDGRWGALALLAFATLNGIVARATHFLADVPFRPDALWPSAGYQTTLSIAWTAAAFAVMFSATRLTWRRAWWAGAALLAAVVLKLFTVDLADIGTVARIVSFIVVGGLILVLGYVSPLPPRRKVVPRG